MNGLRMRLFGTFQAQLNGIPISNFRGNNNKALLIYLALNSGQSHTRAALATLFWANKPKQARGNLRNALYELKQILSHSDGLDEPFLLIDSKSVQFNVNSNFSIDVVDFLAASAALDYQKVFDLYSGEFLEDFEHQSNLFDGWARELRAKLFGTAVNLLSDYAENLLQQGKIHKAEQVNHRLIELEPWHESSHQQLMKIFALRGKRYQVAKQFEQLRDILRTEFQADPSDESQKLYDSLFSNISTGASFANTMSFREVTLPEEEIPNPAPLPQPSIMPLRKNPLFVGRVKDLKTLAKTLNSTQTLAINQTAAATGLGGIGKTQLASEFVHRYGQFFLGGIFWLSFDQPDAIPAEVAACGETNTLNLAPNFSQKSPEEQVKLVQAAWKESIPRLLVFDNCEDPKLLERWRPKTGGCRILVTSRRGDWESSLGVSSLALGVLERTESIDLLKKFRPNLDAKFLDLVAEELGDLPLALHLAGSYLKKYQRSIQINEYLGQLKDPRLLRHQSMQLAADDLHTSPTGHIQHIGRTFAMSYDQLNKTNYIDQLAHQLLIHAAHFAPGEPIWYQLLVKTLKLASDERTNQIVEEAFGRLIELGLIEIEQDDARPGPSEILHMHRLVARFVRDVADADVRSSQRAVEEVVFEETAAVNQSGYPLPLLAWQLHLRSVANIAQAREDAEGAALCSELANHLFKVNDFKSAIQYATKALKTRQAVLGENHVLTAESFRQLGLIFMETAADHEKALSHFNQARLIENRLKDEALPSSLNLGETKTLNLMGLWHFRQGQYQNAIDYYKKALDALQSTSEQPDTPNLLQATIENNIGDTYRISGLPNQALPHLKNALLINKKLLRENHPTIGMNLNNLANAYHDLEKLKDAKPAYEQALKIYQKNLGDQHTDVGLLLNNLGSFYIDFGDLTSAKNVLFESMTIFDESFQAPHNYKAFALNNLGKAYQLEEDYQTAEHYFTQALSIRKDLFDEHNPQLALSYANLGNCLDGLDKKEMAVQHWKKAVAIFSSHGGQYQSHIDTLMEHIARLKN